MCLRHVAIGVTSRHTPAPTDRLPEPLAAHRLREDASPGRSTGPPLPRGRQHVLLQQGDRAQQRRASHPRRRSSAAGQRGRRRRPRSERPPPHHPGESLGDIPAPPDPRGIARLDEGHAAPHLVQFRTTSHHRETPRPDVEVRLDQIPQGIVAPSPPKWTQGMRSTRSGALLLECGPPPPHAGRRRRLSQSGQLPGDRHCHRFKIPDSPTCGKTLLMRRRLVHSLHCCSALRTGTRPFWSRPRRIAHPAIRSR